MRITLPKDGQTCHVCKRLYNAGDDWPFVSPRWHEAWFVCGHERPIVCPTCQERNARYACSQCGETGEKT